MSQNPWPIALGHYSSLLPGSGSWSATGHWNSGPHLQETNSYGILVSEGNQTTVEWWLWDEESGKRRILASPGSPPAHPTLGQQVSLVGAQRADWAQCHAELESPHYGLPLALAQASRQQWTSPLSLSQWPNRSGSLPGPQTVGPGLSPLGDLRSLRASWVGRLTPSEMTAGQSLGA